MNIQAVSTTKSSNPTAVSSKQLILTIKKKTQTGEKTIKTSLTLPEKHNKANKKRQLTPQQIAKRIAEGKSVTPEQRQQLQKENPTLYMKAVIADRMRETLEIRLSNAKSETAQAQAVAQAMAQAITMSESEEKAGVSAEDNGLSLYMDAIKQAIKNASHPSETTKEELAGMVEEGMAQYEQYQQETADSAGMTEPAVENVLIT